MSRQNYYKARKERKKKSIDEALIIELVEAERQITARVRLP